MSADPVGPSCRDAPVAGAGGVLLTGGNSSRLGFDKTLLEARGEALAVRLGRKLAACVQIAVEVGPGRSTLEHVREDEPGQGPLFALVTGVRHLRARGHSGPVVAIASDMPGVDERLLRYLADHPSKRSVVPLHQGMPQVLCARYSAGDLVRMEEAYVRGERSMMAALRTMDAPVMLTETEWARVVAPVAFLDVDTREDLELARRRGLL